MSEFWSLGWASRVARACSALVLGCACSLTACSDDAPVGAASQLAVPSDSDFRGETIADFELTAHDGRTVTRADVLGAPVVLDFIFSTCTGPCPRVSGQMRNVQARLSGVNAKLLSFSVDPETDTPEVLSAYAARFEADAQRWWFLTGPDAQIDGVMKSLWLARAKDAGAALGMQVTHSTRLVVLDALGVVRGMYDGESDQGAAAAAERAAWLAAHPGR